MEHGETTICHVPFPTDHGTRNDFSRPRPQSAHHREIDDHAPSQPNALLEGLLVELCLHILVYRGECTKLGVCTVRKREHCCRSGEC